MCACAINSSSFCSVRRESRRASWRLHFVYTSSVGVVVWIRLVERTLMNGTHLDSVRCCLSERKDRWLRVRTTPNLA